MLIIIKNIIITLSGCFFLIGIFSCIQEDLRQLLLYTFIGHCGYLIIMAYNLIILDPIPNELLNILFFYSSIMGSVTIGFFYCTLSMKRSGSTYQVKSIYDLAQMWLINKKTTSYLILLLLCLSGFPFLPGFLCKWFLIEESFLFNKYLGILSFFMCIFSAYPYIRIINNMILNKNLMLNKKGPRWYFDTLLHTKARMTLTITAFFTFIVTIKPSTMWLVFSYLPL